MARKKGSLRGFSASRRTPLRDFFRIFAAAHTICRRAEPHFLTMEELMYYVWQQRLFSAILSADDSPLEIIHPGLRNLDAGRDFFNAKVKFGDIIWAGNVEMHVRASDWMRHNHQHDPAYESVVLHVVLEADAVVRHASGEPIRTVVMRIPDDLLHSYRMLTADRPDLFSAIHCQEHIGELPQLVMHDWIAALATQRMMNKTSHIRDLIEDSHESWQEALYVMTARSLGTGINSDTFERLARSLPYAFLQKHIDDQLQVRALLMGQAGLIAADDHRLQQEYDFLRAKFRLTPLPRGAWRQAKRRPQAAPELRIEALAALLTSHANLFSDVIETADVDAWQRMLVGQKKMGRQTASSVIINSFIPIMLAYGQWKLDDDLCERALALLEQLPAEANRYVTHWKNAGYEARSAFETQALLHLYRDYCEPHKCLNCRIGCWIVRNQAKPVYPLRDESDAQ